MIDKYNAIPVRIIPKAILVSFFDQNRINAGLVFFTEGLFLAVFDFVICWLCQILNIQKYKKQLYRIYVHFVFIKYSQFLIEAFFVLLQELFLKNMSDTKKTANPVYSKNTIEFVAVAKSLCDFLEQIQQVDKPGFLETMVRLLPLLYLKGTLLPETELVGDEGSEVFATETQYAILAANIAELLGEDDTYLEVFHPDMSMSDSPLAANISENIADIWQDMYNFTETFRQGYDDAMNDALYICRSNFALYWGRSLVNVMRALHSVFYPATENEDEDM
jgi:hypothetical protein